MSTTEFERLCEVLPRLTPDQLEKVRVRLGYLAPADKSTAAAPRREERDWLLRGIEDELRRRRVLGRSLSPAGIARQVPGWPERSAAARAEVLDAIGTPVGPRELAGLGRTVAHALIEYLLSWRDPPDLEPRMVCMHVDKVMVALDAQFPGYAEAGLLGCCLGPGLVGAD